MRKRLPERRQRMDRIKNTRKKCKRQNDEVLEGCELIDLVRLNSRDDAERGHETAARKRVRHSPHRMCERNVHEPYGGGEYAGAHDQTARNRRQQIGQKKLAMRERRQ